MADEAQAQARNRRFRELMEARVTAEANGEVSATDIAAAHERNAALRRVAQTLEAGAAEVSPGTPRRSVNSEVWPG